MHLVFLYGPPAAGKLTVATELSSMTGYKVLDNHKVIDYLPEIFPRSEPQYDHTRSQLGRRIRLDVFEAAAKANVSLITTFAPLSSGKYDFIRDVQRVTENAGGTIHLVQLLPSVEILKQRVVGESHRHNKIHTTERWHEVVDNNPGAFATFPDTDHLVLDNSAMTPSETAEAIIAHYRL